MGATSNILSNIMVTMGSIISVLGVIAGLILGILITLFAPVILNAVENLLSLKLINPEIYFVDYLPIKIRPSDLLTISITSLAIAFVASYLPSRLLTKIKKNKNL